MESAAEDLRTFGRARGLRVIHDVEMPEITPLLCLGDFRSAETLLEGRLAPGLEEKSALAHFSYTNTRRMKGTVGVFHFTVVATWVTETVAFLPLLRVRPKLGPLGNLPVGLGPFEGDEMMTGPLLQPVKLEFRELKARYEISADRDVGNNWARQLFSPAFSEWLTSVPDLAFEVAEGAVCVFRAGHLESEEELTSLLDDAAKIVQRLRNEALEALGTGSAGSSALPDNPDKALAAKIEAGVAKVKWDKPPPDTATAIKAYRGTAARGLQPWVWGGVTLVVSFAVLYFLLFGDGEGKSNPLWLLPSPLAAIFVWGMIASDRAEAFGRAAFAQGYARSRSLTETNPRLYQAGHMSLNVPGRVEVAMTGELPTSGRPGAVLFTRTTLGKDRARWDVVVLENVDIKKQLKNVDDLYIARDGRTFAACREVPDLANRSAEDLDAFVARVSAMAK